MIVWEPPLWQKCSYCSTGDRASAVVRRRLFSVLAAGLATVMVCALGGAPSRAEEPPAFRNWLSAVAAEADSRGLSGPDVRAALDDAHYVDQVVELDRRQPELTQTFWRYLDARVTPERVAQGQEYLAAYDPLLSEVYARFGVQPRVLVALWGLESNFGRVQGEHEVVSSLATLAYDSRRSAFFRQQLFAALDLIHRGDIPPDMRGSWAGAMGQPQFMPTTYLEYAVDGDGDGRRDLRGSLPDVFASAAKYLAAAGWDTQLSWGHEVSLPPGFDYAETGLEIEKPLWEWQQLGVGQGDGTDLPAGDIAARVLLPAGASGPAFIVYRNFRSILRWNNSILYALAVGHLSDRLAGGGPLLAQRPAEELALSRYDVAEMQSRLSNLGFEPGDADGVVGEKTRRAIRMFQKSVALPADGYPDPLLLQRLRTGP
jgi:membrane-bound lytic murein transglycosylase B